MAVRWGHWSAGIQWLRVTRHHAHDSRHSQHTQTLAWPHSHIAPLRVSRQITIKTIFCQMSRRSSYTAQQRRDENMSVLTWRLIRWRGVWRVGMEHSDTGRVIQPSQFTPGLPAQTFNFIQFKHACIACAMICRCRSSLHLTHRP